MSSPIQLNLLDALPEANGATAWLGGTEQAFTRLLVDWVVAGWLRPLELHLAEWLHRQVPEAPPLVRLLAVLASHQAGAGQLCLNLSQLADSADDLLNRGAPRAAASTLISSVSGSCLGRAGEPIDAPPPWRTPAAVLAGGEPVAWCRLLATVPALIGSAVDDSSTPFVLDGDCLYLRRFWRLETQLAQHIKRLLGWQAELSTAPTVRQWLARLFPTDDPRTEDQQRACALALGQRLTVIMGGPGTGKTTTVLKLLILLQAMAASDGVTPLRMALCAPTGKAASRLRESIGAQLTALLAPFRSDFPELAAHLPETVTTLHRLIGLRPNRPPAFDAGHPLPLDVLVIDEASMMGAGLMAQTLAALPASARLILLGDAGQLASVEPGAVLGAMAAAVSERDYHPQTRAWLEAATGTAVSSMGAETALGEPGLADACISLRYSHRFGGDSALGRLAAAVNTGVVAAAMALFTAHDALCWRMDDAERSALSAVADAEILPWLHRAAAGCPAGEQADEWAVGVFSAMRQAQMLCALREGAYGVVGVNERLTAHFVRRQVIAPLRRSPWYAGRPILVTQNDAALSLANGDVGLVLTEPRSGALRAVFYDEGRGELRWLNPQRLPAVETAFALTVHKAQGSEYDHSILIFPPVLTPILTRELLYTAMTRARHRFTLIAADAQARRVFAEAIGRTVRRSGQLAAWLRG